MKNKLCQIDTKVLYKAQAEDMIKRGGYDCVGREFGGCMGCFIFRCFVLPDSNIEIFEDAARSSVKWSNVICCAKYTLSKAKQYLSIEEFKKILGNEDLDNSKK